MSLKDETPDTGRDAEGFKICLLTRAVERRRFNAIKAVAPAMTNQLYTISIKSRKQIENINALVSPKHCEFLPIYDFAAVLQKAKSKLLHEWDNTANCPVAISDVGVCLQTRGNLVTLMTGHKVKGR